MAKTTTVNGNQMPMAYWNLLLSIRDLKLWSKGIKPHRFWKVTDVKNYFAISGNREQLVIEIEQLHEYVNDFLGIEKEEVQS